jgi:hypothetical protein
MKMNSRQANKVLRETPLFFRRPMKDIFNVLRETPLIFRFSIKDSEKAYIWKIKRGLPRGASKCGGEFQGFLPMIFSF